jgi:hypothetical protein
MGLLMFLCFVVFVFVFGWGASLARAANPFVILNNGAQITTCGFPLPTSSSNGVSCAQSFSTSNAMTITSIGAKLRKTGTFTGDIILQLRPDNGGSPSSTVLASATISNANIASSSFVLATTTVNYANTASTTLWLVATTTEPYNDGNYFEWQGTNVDYTGGKASFFKNGSWQDFTQSGATDFNFRVGEF